MHVYGLVSKDLSCYSDTDLYLKEPQTAFVSKRGNDMEIATLTVFASVNVASVRNAVGDKGLFGNVLK